MSSDKPERNHEHSPTTLGVYCETYLERVEKHIYRQILAIEHMDVHVFYQHLKNVSLFPLRNLHSVLPAPGNTGMFKRAWQKYLLKKPAFVYRGCQDLLLQDLSTFEVDVLHLYFGYFAVEMLSLFDYLHIPTVVSFHGADATSFFQKPGYAEKAKMLFDCVTLVFVRSEAMGRQLVQQGCPPEKIRVTKAMIDLKAFPFSIRSFPDEGPVRLLQACRLIPKKGLMTLLKAISIVHPIYPNIRLDIVGTGPLEAELKQQIKVLHLENTVFLPGYLETPGLIQFMQQAHVFIHPSETTPDGDQEGIPNALIEAMATGLPVVATRHAGIPELVVHEENGLLVPETDPDALASAILKLLENTDLWATYGKKARQAVAEQHEVQVQGRRLEGYYLEAIATYRKRKSD